jgi:hypothetical protein
MLRLVRGGQYFDTLHVDWSQIGHLFKFLHILKNHLGKDGAPSADLQLLKISLEGTFQEEEIFGLSSMNFIFSGLYIT